MMLTNINCASLIRFLFIAFLPTSFQAMLLLFQIDNNRYAIDTADIVEIVPMVLLTKIAATPAHIAGVFNYHGNIVPVVDLCQLIGGTPCQACYSTRIVIVNSLAKATKLGDRQVAARLLGLMAEQVTETLKPDTNYLVNAQLASATSYLGEPFLAEQGMIQQVHWQHLVPEAHQAALFVNTRNSEHGAGQN